MANQYGISCKCLVWFFVCMFAHHLNQHLSNPCHSVATFWSHYRENLSCSSVQKLYLLMAATWSIAFSHRNLYLTSPCMEVRSLSSHRRLLDFRGCLDCRLQLQLDLHMACVQWVTLLAQTSCGCCSGLCYNDYVLAPSSMEFDMFDTLVVVNIRASADAGQVCEALLVW